jgi:hypothetical protein
VIRRRIRHDQAPGFDEAHELESTCSRPCDSQLAPNPRESSTRDNHPAYRSHAGQCPTPQRRPARADSVYVYYFVSCLFAICYRMHQNTS